MLAQPKAPDDSYAKLLAGKTLEEGKGFPGIVEVGTPTPAMYKALGAGREVAGMPFWYFYDKGPWTLIVVGEMSMETGGFMTRAIQLAGDKAPATKQGVKIGDPVAKVEKVYGKGAPFSGTVGSPAMAGMVSIDVKTGAKKPLPDVEKAFKDSLFYPKLGTLFVVTGGAVSGIVVVVIDDPLPSFLRDPKAVKPPDPGIVVIDPKVDEPGWGPDASSATLHVPPPPVLAPVVEKGFTVDAPKEWTKAGTVWTDKSGRELVEIVETKGTGTPDAYFAEQDGKLGPNRVPPKQRALPAEFAKLIGADAAYALWKQEGKKGKKDAPLRTFVLMAAKGDRRFTLIVGRTASGASPSPDGEALARGVFRSFRIK
ncbi:MAG: hypothetical protein KIT31_10075 [Deltaproteobacteria bacterium]|nr:hypothetical protein [Deltaproteobacteria bacterium]